ncbi:CBS domain-containing protein [Candidatus Bathyarchaeota archaeon]|nr:CBS domain-containing protein [Candidatus Bathyarchaeota archaeon]
MKLEMKIKDLMKKNPLIVKPGEDLATVSKKMVSKGKDVVIVMDGDIVKGLVTAEDIFFAMKSYVLGKNMLEDIPMEVRDMKVAELMKAPAAMEFMQACGLTGTNVCIVLGEDDKAADAIRVMAISGVDNILIVGDEGVAGTLSEADLIKALA